MVNKVDKYMAKKMIQLRKEGGLTQDELATLMQFNSRISIVNMEQGKQSFTVKSVYLLCCIFNITPNELFPPVQKARITYKVTKKSILKVVNVPKL